MDPTLSPALVRCPRPNFPLPPQRLLSSLGPGKIHLTVSWAHGLSQLAYSLPRHAYAVTANLTIHHDPGVFLPLPSAAGSLREWLSAFSGVLSLLQATGPIDLPPNKRIEVLRATVKRTACGRRKQELRLLEFRWTLSNPDTQQLRRSAPARGYGDISV